MRTPLMLASCLAPVGLTAAAAAGSGACCIDQACIETDEQSCIDAGGQFNGNLGCEIIICLDPLPLGGPCCLGAGGCVQTDIVTCASLGGVFVGGGLDCGNVFCPAPCPGDIDGSGSTDSSDLNLLLSAFGCAGAGCTGDLNGDQLVNSTDLNVLLGGFGCTVAPTTGACCAAGVCHDVTADQCIGLNGLYAGDGTSCFLVLCIIPLPTDGACCHFFGCFDGPAADCAAFGGIFNGEGTTCADVFCLH